MDHNYSTHIKNGTPPSVMKPLTERQQMALLLQMTAEINNSTPTRKGTANETQAESIASTPRSVNRRNERGETPLHVAAIKGDLLKVKSLIAQGADVNTTDFAGWTPLHEAANRGHVSVTRELLRSGAKVDVAGMDGVTPLHDASVNGHEPIVSLLLRFGANPHLKTQSLKTAQDLAGSPQVVRLLAQQRSLDAGDDEEVTDENSPIEHDSNIEPSWKRQKQYPRSRRSLQLDHTSADSSRLSKEIHVTGPLALTAMESAPTNASSSGAAADEAKDTKAELELESSSAQAPTTEESSIDEPQAVKEGEGGNGEACGAVKRPAEANEEDNDDEGKRKRRKGDEPKESKGRAASSNKGKDRKSPNTIQTESAANDSDDEKKGSEPKVPPLKIVLSNSSEADTNVRSKNGNSRASLAYVVSTNDEKNENSNSSSDKGDEKSSGDVEKSTTGSGGSSSNGGRVTRSSQRAAAVSAVHSAPTSGQNSANHSPTSSPTQNPANLNNTPSPDPSEATPETQSAATGAPGAPSVKADDVKERPADEASVEVHPRKRKLRPREAEPAPTATAETAPAAATAGATAGPGAGSTATGATATAGTETAAPAAPPPIVNCYDMYFSIRKQIERRHRGLLPVQPKPPQGFKDYLMNRCTYVIAGNAAARLSVPVVSPPPSLQPPIRDLFSEQEKERYRLRMQHLIEKEKLVLSVEQEILRVHGRAARALANQALPFSVCTLLKDQEVYSALTPEQEEKDRNARSRYNGRLFLSWLQDVDDKWEKIKESMLLRHHNEAESLHAVQRMDWEWKVKELGLCEPQNKPVIDELHVPMVNVSDDFDLLPA